MRSTRRQFSAALGSAFAASVLAGPAAVGGADNAAPGRKKIRIGQIGVGHAHASKLAVYRQSADYEVVGVVETDDELRRKAESQEPYRGLPFLTREQLFNVSGLQAVMVETRVADLLDTAEACVGAGFHIHLDKPAGDSLPQFRRILDAAAKRKLLVQMGYMYRYNPGVVMLRDFLKKGWLGDVFEVHTVMSKVVPASQRRELAKFPGGILFELGCHVIDLVVGLLGKPAKVTAYPRTSAGFDDGLVDNMLAVFEYPQATATVRSSAREVEGFDRRHLTVCGGGGTFHIQPLDDPAVRLSLSKAQGTYRAGTQDVKLPKYRRYVDDAADLARILRGEKETDFPYDHDYAVQETLLAACGVASK